MVNGFQLTLAVSPTIEAVGTVLQPCGPLSFPQVWIGVHSVSQDAESLNNGQHPAFVLKRKVNWLAFTETNTEQKTWLRKMRTRWHSGVESAELP